MDPITQKRRDNVLEIHRYLTQIEVLKGKEHNDDTNRQFWEAAQNWEEKRFQKENRMLSASYYDFVHKKIQQLKENLEKLQYEARMQASVGPPPPLNDVLRANAYRPSYPAPHSQPYQEPSQIPRHSQVPPQNDFSNQELEMRYWKAQEKLREKFLKFVQNWKAQMLAKIKELENSGVKPTENHRKSAQLALQAEKLLLSSQIPSEGYREGLKRLDVLQQSLMRILTSRSQSGQRPGPLLQPNLSSATRIAGHPSHSFANNVPSGLALTPAPTPYPGVSTEKQQAEVTKGRKRGRPAQSKASTAKQPSSGSVPRKVQRKKPKVESETIPSVSSAKAQPRAKAKAAPKRSVKASTSMSIATPVKSKVEAQTSAVVIPAKLTKPENTTPPQSIKPSSEVFRKEVETIDLAAVDHDQDEAVEKQAETGLQYDSSSSSPSSTDKYVGAPMVNQAMNLDIPTPATPFSPPINEVSIVESSLLSDFLENRMVEKKVREIQQPSAKQVLTWANPSLVCQQVLEDWTKS